MVTKSKKQEKVASSAATTALNVEQVGLPADFAPISDRAFAQYIRALRQNWRQGTVAVKGRSDVAYANRKPWKQKGTGRARAGSARSPLWRGGGITFGPQPRTRELIVTRNIRRNTLQSLLYQFAQAGKVMSLNWSFDLDRPKTAHAAKTLSNAGLSNDRMVLFLPAHDTLTAGCFANIPSVRILFFDQPNAYDLAHADCWVVLSRDMEHLKKMVSQWI